MLRVTTIIDEHHICFLFREDAYQNIVLGVTFSKVTAKTALTLVNCLHDCVLRSIK